VRRIVAFCSLRSVLFLAGIAVMLVLGNIHTTAQDIVDVECFDVELGCDVEGTAAILESTDNVEIDSYASEEIISFDLLDQGFEADVQVGLFQDSFDNLIDSNEAFDDGSGFAETDMADTVELGSTYVVESDSYLDDVETGDQFFVGSAFVGVVAAAPEIDVLTPPSASSGASGTLTVDGFALYDQFDGTVQVSPIPGLTWGSSFTGNADGTQIQLTYTIANNAVSGDQSFFLATRFGTSNTAIFAITDPTPVVNSVRPSTWEAGADTSITVTGRFFGSCPTLNITGPGVTGFTRTGFSDTQMTGTVTVDASSSGGTATVDVISDGETCSGFFGNPGQPADGSNTATVDPIKPPAPQIQYFKTDVASPQPIEVGQKVDLTFTANLPSGLTIQSQTWTVSGTAISQFTAGTATSGEKVTALSSSLTTGEITFYWLTAGSASVTLTYCANNGQCSDQVTANFSVSAPTGPTINMTPGTVDVVLDPVTGFPALLFKGSTNGMTMVAKSTLPSSDNGQYQWIQLINNDTSTVLDSTGPGTCSTFTSTSNSPELDLTYPYGKGTNTVSSANGIPNDTAVDDPKKAFNPQDGNMEWRRIFKATMYLEWVPTKDGKCGTDNSCAIPVPLASGVWSFSGCATDTAIQNSTGTTWQLNCSNVPAPAASTPITPSSSNGFGYPTWSATIGSCKFL
jgi:hypothetical protein